MLRDAHWSYLAVAAFLVLISMWNVKSLTENSYIVPMSIAFTYLLLAIGNAIAAFGIGLYLWREHPKIGEDLRRHPLGESADGE